jgi:hypothetical protein
MTKIRHSQAKYITLEDKDKPYFEVEMQVQDYKSTLYNYWQLSIIKLSEFGGGRGVIFWYTFDELMAMISEASMMWMPF